MPVEGNQLETYDYERLRQATRTHREELVIRLCGEAGLRAGELTRLQPADVTEDNTTAGTRHFVTVREADGETRTAYFPADVAHDFSQYVRSNNIDSETPVIDVSERRVQMLVRDVCERAATQNGRTVFDEVTPSTLRQYFAQQLLIEHGADARVVAAVGGWEGVDPLLDGLDTPSREEVGATFEQLDAEKRRQPGRPGAVMETLGEAAEAILDASSRAEIEQRACKKLSECYRAVWILEWGHHREQVTVRTHAGESPDRFSGAANTSLVRQALQTDKAIVAPDDPGPASKREGRGLLAAIPIAQEETQYGALVVRSDTPEAFDDPERTALSAFGQQIAFAISAAERKHVLLGGAVLEVRFQYNDRDAPLVALAASLGCELSLEGAVAGNNGFLCFVHVKDVEPKTALEAANEIAEISDARLVRSSDGGGVLEIELQGGSPLLLLTERGGTVTELSIEDGQALLTCELSPDADLRAIHDDLRKRFPSFELRSKQERQATRDSLDGTTELDEQLTDKQQAVLQAAYHSGYFEWPRESTAEDLADSMDVSSPTLHNHLRKAQQKLLENILD